MISVIVPVYNVDNYLNRCLDSIINQSYKNFEIIIVDDGSTDKSPAICDSYSKKYDFISVIHQNNGGLSVARNTGILAAKGNFITYIDSDDLNDFYRHIDNYKKQLETLNDESVALCGLTSMENESLRNSSFYYTHTTSAFRKVFFRKKLQTDDFQYKRMFLSGACFAMKKDIFEKILDEDVFLPKFKEKKI